MESRQNQSPVLPVPEMALLSRTLSSSSITKWILPARIRSAAKNDVVFIGDTSIQLREFVSTSAAHLVDITGKFDFRAHILAAKVISAASKPINFPDQVVHQTVEDEEYIVKDKPLPECYPPHILVLSLASCELVFVYAQESLDGTVAFRWARRPVLLDIDLPDKYGRHLAIDPASRALAFAPAMGSFAIVALRPVDEIKDVIDGWRPSSPKSFLPWTEQRFVQVDGYVVKMDFLQSADDDPTKVILVLLVANAGETSILLYRWDTRVPLHRIKPMRCSGQVLPVEDSFPLMLIPCRGLASFFIVTETELVLYSQVAASQTRRSAYPLPTKTTKESKEPSRHLLWTQWAKPKRHELYKSTNDDIILVREDGLLQLFFIVHKPDPRAKVSTCAGHLRLDVDTAFCMLATPSNIGGGDILIAGGNMTTGGVYHLKPRQPTERIQSLPNAAPFRDLLLLGDGTTQPSDFHERKLLACCGNKEGEGTIAEIHHGIESQVGWTMLLPDAGSIERIWTIESECQDLLLLLLSHPLHTSLVIFNVRTTEAEDANSETHSGIEFNSPTLAAAKLGGDTLVQLTATCINVMSLTNRFPSVRMKFRAIKPLCAAVIESVSAIIIAHPTLDGFGISLIGLGRDTVNVEPSMPIITLQSQPVCICVACLREETVVLICTEQGQVLGYLVGQDQGLVQVLAQSLSDIDPSIQDSTVSSICLLSRNSDRIGLLLCGFRSGHLLCIELDASKEPGGLLNVKLAHGTIHRLGVTTVSVSPDNFTARKGYISSALAVCRSTMRRIDLKENSAGADFDIASVFIVDREISAGPVPVVNVAHRIQRLQSPHDIEVSGLLVCATSSELLFSAMVAQQQAVMRHTPVTGIPRRVIYSPYLNQLVVGVDASSGPSLIFMAPSSSPDDGTFTPSQTVQIETSGDQAKSETDIKINNIVNYRPTDCKKHFEFVVVSLNKTQTDSSSGAITTTGSVVCLSLPRILKGKAASAKIHPVIKFTGRAVTSLSVYGDSSLLIGTESKILLHNLDMETNKWQTLSDYELPSAAITISTRGGLIFLATRNHSLMLLRESKNNLVMLASDTQARNTSNVLSFAGRKTILTSFSDKGTTVTGFKEDPHTGGLGRTFEGTVPLLVDRLVEETADLPSDRARSSFVGATADGTLYRFMTINPAEWELLRFLETLHKVHKEPAKRRTMERQARQQVTEGRMRPRPLETHIDGDALMGTLEPGYMNLRNLLEPCVKQEHENRDDRRVRDERMQELKKLADPLVGESDDVVGVVLIWLRRILNWTAD